MKSNSNKIVFFSSCIEPWGGSEELWSQAAEIFAGKNYKIHIFKLIVNFSHPRIRKLLELGCEITDLTKYLPDLAHRVLTRLLPSHGNRILPFYIKRILANRIKKINPRLIVISQGANFDGLPFFQNISLENYRYVIISQKAIKYLFPDDLVREFMKRLWQNSQKNYFVSRNNLEITQEQFGLKMTNAEVVYNPFLAKVNAPLEWNFSPDETVKIACVGRFYTLDKGQDILLRILAQEKWRKRNVEISFYGKGINEDGIKDLARYLKLENIYFRGHASDIVSIWKDNQALVLPARNEGLPLVVVEAMMCGSVPIVTNVGGNREVIEDNVTGFIAQCADEESFDEAMERAWQRRDEWQQIGESAAEKIREIVPENPAEVFAGKLEKIVAKKVQVESEFI